jgi:peptidoglycan/xylan/chitin deacetylase (PgdA/CDA1 family)
MEKQLVSLTFDDGWLSQYENALPHLEDYRLPGTFYIITNRMKKGGLLYMNQDQVQNIATLGHEIGSHSMSHPSLLYYFCWINKDKEIRKSKEVLESVIGKRVTSFAYPYGRFSEKIIKLVSDAGYENARSTGERFQGNFPGFNSKASGPFDLQCKSVKKDTTLEEIKEWITTSLTYNFWLILNFHQVVKNPYKWGCTPHFFQQICELLKQPHIKVENVSDVFKEFSFQAEKGI